MGEFFSSMSFKFDTGLRQISTLLATTGWQVAFRREIPVLKKLLNWAIGLVIKEKCLGILSYMAGRFGG
jgi:hypothetical protein